MDDEDSLAALVEKLDRPFLLVWGMMKDDDGGLLIEQTK